MTFQDVEKARQAYYSKIKKQVIITVVIIVVLTILFMSSGSGYMGSLFVLLPIIFFAAMFATIISTLLNRKAYWNYRHAYKGYFVEQNLKTVFTDLYYSHEMGISSTSLNLTGMINMGDRFSSNDFTKGKYKNVTFCQADVHIETEYTDSDGDTHYTTIFRGRFMIFEFPKQFKFRLGLAGKRFSAFRKPGVNRANGRKMEKISTESNEFNDSFRIYAEDGFEAYYILDPAFMVKLLDINTHYKGKTIFCFNDNALIIGINDGKDSFEPPRPYKAIDEAAENAKVSTDIKMITDLVDQLSLSRKCFKSS